MRPEQAAPGNKINDTNQKSGSGSDEKPELWTDGSGDWGNKTAQLSTSSK